MKLTAQDIFNKLIAYKGQTGAIFFELGGLQVNIESRDSVGNLLQEWIRKWFQSEGIDFVIPDNTQDFPDFYLDGDNLKTGLLEVKSFNYNQSPTFDVAAFQAYARSLLSHPYRLDSDYLIIGYSMNGSIIEIKDIWLKRFGK